MATERISSLRPSFPSPIRIPSLGGITQELAREILRSERHGPHVALTGPWGDGSIQTVSENLSLVGFRRGVVSAMRGTGALVLATVALVPHGAFAFILSPELKLEARYDDNIDRRENGSGDLVRVITPGLGAARAGRIASWQVWGRRSLISYTQSAASPTTTDAVSLRAAYARSAQTSLATDLQYLRSKDDLQPDQRSVPVSGQFKDADGTANLTLLGLEASAQVAAWDYSTPDRTDATTRRLAVNFIPMRTRTHAWLLSYRGQELDLSGKRSLASAAVLAGFRRRHSRRLASEWGLGVAEVKDRPGASAARRMAVTAGLKIFRRDPGEEVIAEARLERDAATTMKATVRKRLPIGAASVNWETRLNAEGGYYTQPTVARRASAAIVDTLAPGTTLSFEASYGWTRPFRGPEHRADTYRAGAFLSTPVQPWINGRVGYDFLRQTDPDRAVPLNFRRSRLVLSLTAVIP